MDLTGRRYLVTGAASGIGRATAVMLSRLGAVTACVDVDEEGQSETAKLLAGDGHLFEREDLQDLARIPQWLCRVAERMGRLHGFVHAAGLPAPWPLKALSCQLWRPVMTINAEAGVVLAQAFQKQAIYAGEYGSLVYISSVMAHVGSPAASAYSMSKAAVEGAARSLAIELARVPIRVNCIAPGFVRTPMMARLEKQWAPGQAEEIARRHPLGLGAAEDVASAAAFLLADTARWITGSLLTVDGGYTAQ
jgi:NAD(P)-dependent dehydrogenase (short-subunit alcohol dehydrogenase family)